MQDIEYCVASRAFSIPSGNKESSLESLLVIESRIAISSIVQREIFIRETLRATNTLGNGVLKVGKEFHEYVNLIE